MNLLSGTMAKQSGEESVTRPPALHVQTVPARGWGATGQGQARHSVPAVHRELGLRIPGIYVHPQLPLKERGSDTGHRAGVHAWDTSRTSTSVHGKGARGGRRLGEGGNDG